MGGEAGEEGGDPSAVGRDLVAVASGEALDDPLEAQPSQVVGGLGARVALVVEPGHARAERGVGEPVEDGVKGADRSEEGDHAWVAEAQSRGALAVVDARHDDGDERARVGQPRCAVTEGAEEALVDLGSGVL